MTNHSCAVPGRPSRIVSFRRVPGEAEEPAEYHVTLCDLTSGTNLSATLDRDAAALLAETLTAAVNRP